jgi:glycine betaine/proline transport system substrate-binding protein
MRKSLTFLGGFAAASMLASAAFADCGEVSMTEMNWPSSQVITHTAKFLMEQGYGCTVEMVPSATITSIASLAENNEPDIVTELWLNSAGEAYLKLETEGKVKRLTEVFNPGGVDGWWIPQYLADKHPELQTVADVMANPELVGNRFNNCPVGWGCRIVNDNIITALGLRDSMDVFDHGSGETLSGSIAAAAADEAPWFGYYWAPTAVLGKYPMKRLEIGPVDEAIHLANQTEGNDNPGVSDFPAAPVLTVATTDFAERAPEISELMSNVSFEIDTLNAVLAWADENGASTEEAAVHFIQNYSDTWSGWINDAAREKLAGLIK